MFRALDLLPNGQRPLVERLRGNIVSKDMVPNSSNANLTTSRPKGKASA